LPLPAVDVRVDEWVLPSHAQAARVADGSLDLAICWLTREDQDRHRLAADLLWAQPLTALVPTIHPLADAPIVPARSLGALVDTDQTSWSSWNRYATASSPLPAPARLRSPMAASPDPLTTSTYAGCATRF